MRATFYAAFVTPHRLADLVNTVDYCLKCLYQSCSGLIVLLYCGLSGQYEYTRMQHYIAFSGSDLTPALSDGRSSVDIWTINLGSMAGCNSDTDQHQSKCSDEDRFCGQITYILSLVSFIQ